MTYEFFAILKDGQEVSVVNEDEAVVKKAMQDFIETNFMEGWDTCTMYLPHENAEQSKQRARDNFSKKGRKK
jgi:3-isopropylmalate dehydratase small subunit